MKLKNLLLLALVVVILAACQSGGAPNGAPAKQAPGKEYPAPQGGSPETNPPTGASNPSAGATYPAPGQEQAVAVYPDLQNGAEISWDQAVTIIRSGQVTQILQAGDLKVTLMLKDGRSLISTAPVAEAAKQVIQECGDACKDISLTSG